MQAAVYGSNTPWGTSDSELVVRTIVDVASSIQSQRSSTNSTSEQRSNQRPLRLWLLSGQVLLDIPDGRSNPPRIEGDVLPIHPEHYANYAYVKEHGASLDWSLLCPGKVDDGEVSFHLPSHNLKQIHNALLMLAPFLALSPPHS